MIWMVLTDSRTDIADNVVDQFGDQVADEMRKAISDARKQIRNSRIHDYEIESPVPGNCQIVPEDVEIPYGTKVAACFHFDWSPATVIANNDDGTLLKLTGTNTPRPGTDRYAATS